MTPVRRDRGSLAEGVFGVSALASFAVPIDGLTAALLLFEAGARFGGRKAVFGRKDFRREEG